MMVARSLLVLSLASMLAACGADPDPQSADAATDTAQGDASDGAADVSDVTDAATPDASADVATDTAGDAAEVAVDVVSDAGADVTDAATDTAPSDAPVDAARDVVVTDASDAGADVTDAGADAGCVEGAVRCDSALVAQTCRGGVWVSTACRGYSGALNTYESCYAGACFDCNAGDGGVGCSLDPPLCQTDEECYRNGRGRCVEGRCARRGPVECATMDDCSVWAAPLLTPAIPGCISRTIAGRTAMVCETNERCTIDANCPAAYRCNTATGFCARR